MNKDILLLFIDNLTSRLSLKGPETMGTMPFVQVHHYRYPLSGASANIQEKTRIRLQWFKKATEVSELTYSDGFNSLLL